MLRKFGSHFSLALAFFALTLAQQYGFYALKGLPIEWLPFGKYVAVFLAFFLFTFSPGPYLRFILLGFLLFLNFFQMAHLSYFGTLVLPNELFLFVAERREIVGTLVAELSHVTIPLLFTLVPLAAGLYLVRRSGTLYSFALVPVLFALYLVYNPVRTYLTENTWGRQPSVQQLSGMNLYLSLSYFFGRLLPAKLQFNGDGTSANLSAELELRRARGSGWDNVVVVLGESLTPNRMSLYGYPKRTTPFLEGLKSSRRFYAGKSLASGVSTETSVAFFLNLVYGDAGGMRAIKGERCLFRLAKENGFSTHYLSTQSSQQLRYIDQYLCRAYLDDYRPLESISPGTARPEAAVDRDVLPRLDELLETGGKRFIVLHQRGSHAPWGLRYRPVAARFSADGGDPRGADYDNSVVEFDLFWEELNAVLATKSAKTLVVYLSDHGEALGEENLYGHGFLIPSNFEVPLILQAYNRDLPGDVGDLPANLPQYGVGLFLARELGWHGNHGPHEILRDYVIFGDDIDGFAGRAAIDFGPGSTYTFRVYP